MSEGYFATRPTVSMAVGIGLMLTFSAIFGWSCYYDLSVGEVYHKGRWITQDASPATFATVTGLDAAGAIFFAGFAILLIRVLLRGQRRNRAN